MAENPRKQIYQRLQAEESYFDHEIVEMLISNAFPKLDAVSISKSLLTRFQKIPVMFSASVSELVSVNGVTEPLALYIKVVGSIYDKVKPQEELPIIKTFDQAKTFIKKRFGDLDYEKIEFYLLDDHSRLITIYEVKGNNSSEAEASVPDLIKELSSYQPHRLLFVHNHIYDAETAVKPYLEPTKADNKFTCKVLKALELLQIRFFDHIIYHYPNDYYSYEASGLTNRLAYLQNITVTR